MGFIKDKWTEAEVLALPEGEHNYFDRKSGAMLSDMHNFQEQFAKAMSALSNSGGGHIIFGQENDGTVTGVEPKVKRTSMREWLEQKLPTLLSYPLENFRVHDVVKDAVASVIPAGKVLIVIDVGDSRLAPHQANFPPDRPQYYYRQGGKSVAAPHHYLEALRNRLTAAVLEAHLVRLHAVQRFLDGDDHAVIEIRLHFNIKNTSRIACYKWGLEVGVEGDGIDDFVRTKTTFPQLGTVGGVRLDTTILPTRVTEHLAFLGFRVNLKESLTNQVQQNWPKITIRYYPISENHIGEEEAVKLESVPANSPILDLIRTTFPQQTAFAP